MHDDGGLLPAFVVDGDGDGRIGSPAALQHPIIFSRARISGAGAHAVVYLA